MSPTSRENGRKTWRGPRRWDIHTSALLIFRRLEVSRKTMEIQAFSSALADGIEISLRRRNPIVDREGSAIVSYPFLNRFPYLHGNVSLQIQSLAGSLQSFNGYQSAIYYYKLITRSSLVGRLCPREAAATDRVIAMISRVSRETRRVVVDFFFFFCFSILRSF